MATKRRCAACRTRELLPGRYWKRWEGRDACPTCYERARRGGNFHEHAGVRREAELELFEQIEEMARLGYTEREMSHLLGRPKSTIHDCRVRNADAG